MEEISIVREWKEAARRQARIEVIRSNLLLVLQKRFSPDLPNDLKDAINQETDLQQLAYWFDAALDVSSLTAFHCLIHSSENKP
jgi:hypothetical protein